MVAAPMPANRSETAPPRSENVAELSVVPGQATDAARISRISQRGARKLFWRRLRVTTDLATPSGRIISRLGGAILTFYPVFHLRSASRAPGFLSPSGARPKPGVDLRDLR